MLHYIFYEARLDNALSKWSSKPEYVTLRRDALWHLCGNDKEIPSTPASYLEPVEYVTWAKHNKKAIPETLVGISHGDLHAKNILPRDILTPAAFQNALAVDMAVGGSTNTSLHLPAIAAEAGLTLDLAEFSRAAARTPHLVLLKPAGRHFPLDFFNAGGVPALMKELLDVGLFHGDCMTVTGGTMAANQIAGRRILEAGSGSRGVPRARVAGAAPGAGGACAGRGVAVAALAPAQPRVVPPRRRQPGPRPRPVE